MLLHCNVRRSSFPPLNHVTYQPCCWLGAVQAMHHDAVCTRNTAALCPINDQRVSLEDHTEATSIMQEQIDSLQLKLRSMEAQVGQLKRIYVYMTETGCRVGSACSFVGEGLLSIKIGWVTCAHQALSLLQPLEHAHSCNGTASKFQVKDGKLIKQTPNGVTWPNVCAFAYWFLLQVLANTEMLNAAEVSIRTEVRASGHCGDCTSKALGCHFLNPVRGMQNCNSTGHNPGHAASSAVFLIKVYVWLQLVTQALAPDWNGMLGCHTAPSHKLQHWRHYCC